MSKKNRDPLERVPLLSLDKNDGDDAFDDQEATSLFIDPPPYSDLPPTSGLKQPTEPVDPTPAIPPTSKPSQYDPREYQADPVHNHDVHVVILQQPTTVTDSKEQSLHRPQDYDMKFLLLIVCSTFACFFGCWPLALSACVITYVAFRQNNKNQNPQALINAAFCIIAVSFIFPLVVIYLVLISNDAF